jgi:DNA-directed RNA polymerase subunit H (RpoH/RPB5)
MSDLTRIYFNARRTVIQMMLDRGYTPPTGMIEPNYDEFSIQFNLRHMDVSGFTTPDGVPVYVKLIAPNQAFKTVANKEVVFGEIRRALSVQGIDMGSARLIIAYNSRQGPKPSLTYEKAYINDPKIEVFQVHNLSINPTESHLQPKFKLITSKTEIDAICKPLSCTSAQFPSMCFDDPINRYYRGKVGDVYEITRLGPTGASLAYRRVVGKLAFF